MELLSLLACRLFPLWVKFVEELYSQQPPRNSGGHGSLLIFLFNVLLRGFNQVLTPAASSIALSKASSLRFHRSISPLSAEIFQAVRITDYSPLIVFVFLTTAHSTRPRWQRCRMEAVARSDIFKLPRAPNSHRGWRAPRCHPIRAGSAPRSRRAGNRASRVCCVALYWEHVRVQEAVEGHRRKC
jgi:hypothetical protein